MYNIIRKHSDEKDHIVETVSNKAEAKKYIKAQIDDLAKNSTAHTIAKLGDVTNIKFTGIKVTWSIGYWFEKA